MAADDPLAQPRVTRAWYVLCESGELGEEPVVRELFGQPVVLFRDAAGVAGALLDRCPHRNVPLSMGKVVEGGLACGYHGWRFSREGRCVHVPALMGEADTAARRCAAYATREQQGFVWVWGEPGEEPAGEPFRFRLAEDRSYLTIRKRLEAEASVHAVAENALDVPHTAFAHAGLFREDGERQEIECRLKREHDRVEVEYVGESRPEGLAGKILSPSGGEVVHFDRFVLPSIVEVEYRIGEENHILLNGALTPVDDHRTVLWAVVSARARLPLWLVRPIIEPVALRIFGQDQVILRAQTQTLHRFGDARFVSTELDLLGPHILRLMRQAERGELEAAGGQAYEKTVRMMV